MKHTAIIECSHCGHMTRIALGLASHIACPNCKAHITLGEETLETLCENEARDMLIQLKGKLVSIAREWLSEELYHAEQPETAEMMRGARMAAGMCAREILEVVS